MAHLAHIALFIVAATHIPSATTQAGDLYDSIDTWRDVRRIARNNLANSETTAFKADRPVVAESDFKYTVLPGQLDSAGQRNATGTFVGTGVRLETVTTDHSQGTLTKTGQPLEIAIAGRGFFQVIHPSGEIIYTRAGIFSVNANNQLVRSSLGRSLLIEPSITLPDDWTGIAIGCDGTVSVRQHNQTTMQQVGQLNLAMFVNEAGLMKKDGGYYTQTDASNTPVIGIAGQNGLGEIRQHYLEQSNVDVPREQHRVKKATRMIRLLQEQDSDEKPLKRTGKKDNAKKRKKGNKKVTTEDTESTEKRNSD